MKLRYLAAIATYIATHQAEEHRTLDGTLRRFAMYARLERGPEVIIIVLYSVKEVHSYGVAATDKLVYSDSSYVCLY